MTSIPRLSAGDPPEKLAEALDSAGCLVVTDACTRETRESLRADLAPHMDAAEVHTDPDAARQELPDPGAAGRATDPLGFYPGHTRRAIALVARSVAVGKLVLHPAATGLCDRFLRPNSEFGYQLHVTAALEVGPGARAQVLHREEDSYSFFTLPKPNLILATMWAVTDFTADNGATRLVPGSHRWDANRKPTADEIVSAEMPAGSVLFWLGGLLHGAGANTSTGWRYGVILTYSLGWLRQEENQYLDTPPAVAERLSPELRAMIGYKMHRALGFSTDTSL